MADEHDPLFSFESKTPGSTQSSSGNSAVSDARAAALQGAETATRRGPGRPRKDGTNPSGTRAPKPQSAPNTISPELDAEMRKQLEQCYDPKAWGALLAMPADAALAITGHEHWNVKKDERETLGACGGTAARFMMVSSPKTLAFMMLASALFSVYVPRAVMEVKAMRAEKKQEVKDANTQKAT
jgi:hypothetical protein